MTIRKLETIDDIFSRGGMIGANLSLANTSTYPAANVESENLFANITPVGTFTEATNSTTINLPSGLQANDIVIIASFDDDPVNITAPSSGWTTEANQQSGNGGLAMAWSWKRMGSTPDTTATVYNGGTNSGHVAIAFRNVNTTVALDNTSPNVSVGTTGDPNPPSIRTTTNNSLVVALGFLDDDLSETNITLTNYTLIANAQFGSAAAGGTIMAAYRERPRDTTEDPPTFATPGADEWKAATLALKPKKLEIPGVGNITNSGVWDLNAVYKSKNISLPIEYSALLVDRKVLTGTPASFTSDSFTVPDNCLLVVFVDTTDSVENNVPTGTTLSGGGYTWTRQLSNGHINFGSSGYSNVHEVWTAPVVTGGSKTITWTRASGGAGDSAGHFQIFAVTNYNVSDPIGTKKIESSAATDGAVTLTLDSSPAATSLVIAGRFCDSTSATDVNATSGADWIEIYDCDEAVQTGYSCLQTQIRTGNTSTSVSWSDVAVNGPLYGGSASLAAIEIKGA